MNTTPIYKKRWFLGCGGLFLLAVLFGSFWTTGYFSDSDKSDEIKTDQNPLQSTETPIPESTASQEIETKEDLFKVTRVIDGDTIELEGGTSVRYIGIDTPETVNPNIQTECLGKEASAKNKELVEGKMVRLEKDVSETDSYGRLLRYVYVDGTFVNDYLVREGYANAVSYPPDIKYQDQFREAETEARENNRGLWDSCNSQQTTPPSIPPVTDQNDDQNQSQFTCNCSKTCTQISSCEEAQYQLNRCGCSARDGDNDGTACDGAPLNCQN